MDVYPSTRLVVSAVGAVGPLLNSVNSEEIICLAPRLFPAHIKVGGETFHIQGDVNDGIKIFLAVATTNLARTVLRSSGQCVNGEFCASLQQRAVT